MTIKQQRRLTNLTNPTMVYSSRSSCIDLPVLLVDCQVEDCPSRLQHVCQREYVILNYNYFDGAEWKIFRDCVDKLRDWGKSETSKKVGYSTVYRKDELE